jgi:hypothetical protein
MYIFQHEDGSVQMFERIFTQLESEFRRAKLDETDKEFIKTLIKVPNDFRNPDFKVLFLFSKCAWKKQR